MPSEIERKFLVDRVPGTAGAVSTAISQGYLTRGGDSEVRIRRTPEGSTLTVKHGGGLERAEYETPLDEEQVAALWPATEGARLTKVRTEVPLEDGRTAQLDTYEGALAGLLTVEVEFDSTAEATAFEPPDWFGTDVTGRSEYNNRNLCLRGTPPTEEPTA
ncbi:CYTH domain-containing protein [Kitasatospora sp. NPDC059747]|uniref:CYTH domain-containing protein n=1 Tax=Kitasatospora sp. NPDC059747 TaxID=3346930 RepID=UPI00365BBB55